MKLDLQTYVEATLKAGASKSEARSVLIEAGWGSDLIDKTLAQYIGVDAHGVLIPAPRGQAQHVFQDLLVYFLLLFTMSLAMVALAYIGMRSVDIIVNGGLQDNDTLNWMLAQVIIAFPAYWVIYRWNYNRLLRFTEKRLSYIRKATINLLMVAAAMTALVDGMVALSRWFSGETAWFFWLKALWLLLLMGGVFLHYWFDVQEDDALVGLNLVSSNAQQDTLPSVQLALYQTKRWVMAGFLVVLAVFALLLGLFLPVFRVNFLAGS